MVSVLGTAIWAAILAAVHFLYRKWCTYSAFRVAVHRHGCQTPPKYPHNDPFGLGRDLVQERAKAFKDGRGQALYAEHFQAYGKTFEERSYGRRVISTIEPANFQHVAALHFKDFIKGDRKGAGPSIKIHGHGVVNAEGHEWKQSRDLIKPIFSRGELADLGIIDKHVQRLLDAIPNDGTTIDAQPLLQNLFLDASSEFLLGESLDSLSAPSEVTKGFLNAFDQSLYCYTRWRAAPWFYHFMYRFDRTLNDACTKIHAFIDTYVQRALRETASAGPGTVDKGNNSEARVDPSQRYVLINELAKKIRDPVQLRSQLLNVFLVARDNVAMVTANALFHLARNPHIWTELRQTTLEQISEQPLTFELLKSLTLFKFVFHETLRLQGPAIPINRTAIRDTILPRGGGPNGKAPIFLEKGTIVHLNTWSLHHDSDIWGDDSYTFRPGRWEGASQRFIWEFVPFLGGPRICPALQQVYTQFALVMVRLTQKFASIENRDAVLEYVTSIKLTYESKNGVQIALISA